MKKLAVVLLVLAVVASFSLCYADSFTVAYVGSGPMVTLTTYKTAVDKNGNSVEVLDKTENVNVAMLNQQLTMKKGQVVNLQAQIVELNAVIAAINALPKPAVVVKPVLAKTAKIAKPISKK